MVTQMCNGAINKQSACFNIDRINNQFKSMSQSFNLYRKYVYAYLHYHNILYKELKLPHRNVYQFHQLKRPLKFHFL